MKKSKAQNPRINVEISAQKLEELNQLIEMSGCSSKKDFFNNLIVLYKWMIRKKKDGKHIGAFKDGNYIELEMPIFDVAAYEQPQSIATGDYEPHRSVAV